MATPEPGPEDREIETLRRRYGDVVESVPLARLTTKRLRNRTEARALRDRIAELEMEAARLDAEFDRMSSLHGLLAQEVADEVRRRMNEGWSPTPILGYRVWAIDDRDRVVGAAGHHWDRPTLRASCADAAPGDDLPHTDRSCSRLGHGCGIYAAKSPVDLQDFHPGSAWILGTVAMSGKVVEHDTGYRAATATVTAAVAVVDDLGFVATDASDITRLLARPTATVLASGTRMERRPHDIIATLERSTPAWISETSCA